MDLTICTAHTGARYYKFKRTRNGEKFRVSPNLRAKHMPITVEEVVDDVARSYNEGARFFHIHARDSITGEQTADIETYRRIFSGIKNIIPGVLVSGNTSRKGLVGEEIVKMQKASNYSSDPEIVALTESPRYNSLLANPTHITMFTEPDIDRDFPRVGAKVHYHDWRNPEATEAYFRNLFKETEKRNVHHEVEIVHRRSLDTLERLTDNPDFKLGNVGGTLHAVLLPGFSEQLPVSRTSFEYAISRVGDLKRKTGLKTIITVGSVIRPDRAAKHRRGSSEALPRGQHDYRELIEWVVDHNENAETLGLPEVDCLRVGVEDTPVMYGHQVSTPELVKEAVKICKEYGIQIQTNLNRVREMHGFNFYHPLRKEKIPTMSFIERLKTRFSYN